MAEKLEKSRPQFTLDIPEAVQKLKTTLKVLTAKDR
jgi:hypothetical protein